MVDSFSNIIFQTMENEESLLSDHELHHRQDLLMAERKKKGEEIDLQLETSARTARDMEDDYLKELNEFTPASRISEADKSNDLTSPERARDQPLILVVENKVHGIATILSVRECKAFRGRKPVGISP